MRIKAVILAALLTAAPFPALAQAQTDTLTPTIPATQIEALQLASTYEFLSTSSGVDEFQTKVAELAASRATSPEVKAFAQKMSDEHLALLRDATNAGQADGVELAGATIDGEQQGLLTKMETLEGEAFDRAFMESQIFVHQRAIATYKGYAKEPNNLGRFAAAALPKVIAHYEEALALAQKFGIGAAQQSQAPAEGAEQTEAQGEDAAQ